MQGTQRTATLVVLVLYGYLEMLMVHIFCSDLLKLYLKRDLKLVKIFCVTQFYFKKVVACARSDCLIALLKMVFV